MNKAQLFGIEQVEKILNNLPGEVQRKILQPALRNSAKPILESAKTNIATAPGGNRLIEAIKIKAKRKKAALPGVFVGGFPKVRATKRSEAAWEAMGAYWLEFGTMEFMTIPRSHKTRSLISAQRRVGVPPSKRGRVAPVAWLRRAVDTNNAQTTEGFRKVLWEGMNKFFRKHPHIKWSGTL